MKKAELKEGVRYFVSTRPGWEEDGYTSHAKTAEHNRRHCYTVQFKDGAPMMSYNGQVFVSRVNGGNEKVSLSAIRGEWIECVKIMTENYRKRLVRWNDRGAKYEAHLRRKAQRERETLEAPLRKEFYQILGRLSKGYVSKYHQIESLEFEVMSYIVKAIKEMEINTYSQSA